MATRAQPVKPLFQRMARIVRELAEETDKSVRLRTEGEATEVDRTVIERLADPLTHMIRNAVDHGLETREARLAAGKPEQGEVRLSAAHRSGRIVIEVSDDGGGINREKVRAKAIEKDLIQADAQLSDGELDNLLFLPGFSTATTVSNISGRGVGMDVVKRSVQALGGRISIASRPGLGSTFSHEPAADARRARRHGGQRRRSDLRRAADGDRRDAEAAKEPTFMGSASKRASSPIAAASRL